MKILIEIPENKISFAKEFFKNISFIKNIKVLDANQITNSSILKEIDEYENKKVTPTPVNIEKLKKLIGA
jgi:hypothetical protein